MGSSSSSGSSALKRRSAAVAEASVATSVHATSAPKVRKLVVPLSEPRLPIGPPSRKKRTISERLLNGKTFTLHTIDGVELDSLWCVPATSTANGFAALVFHGNGMTLDDMAPWAFFYTKHGFHTLLVTMRGYPGSSGDSTKDGEPGMYCDAAAAVAFAREKSFDEKHTLAHGFSLGGSLAAAAACHHGLAALTLDHTFTSLEDVGKRITARSPLPPWLVAGAVRGAYKPGTSVELGNGVSVMTDGLNTLEKVRKYHGALFVIYATQDELMPVTFATRFLGARNVVKPPDEIEPAAHAEMQGTHNNPMFPNDDDAVSVYLQHLHSRLNIVVDPVALPLDRRTRRRKSTTCQPRGLTWLLVEGGPYWVGFCLGSALSGLRICLMPTKAAPSHAV